MRKMMFTIIAILFVMAGLSVAAEKKRAAKIEKLTGSVVKVDAKAGSITIKAGEKEHALKAEAKLLEGVSAGDEVEVEVSGHTVKSLKKVEKPAPAPAPAAPAPAPSAPK